jgi:predicted nucleic-acid-binding protein
MRGLDTNVLLRYLTADDAKQLAAAESVIHQARLDREPLFVAAVVLCEVVWGLRSVYALPKAVIVETLERLLGTAGFEFEHHQAALSSLEAFRAGQGDYSDYLIRDIGLSAGCRDIVTFDRALRKAEGFQVLS